MTRVAFLYFPAGTSSQLPPTMLQSIIKRRAKRMLLSYVRKLFEPRPSIVMPLSRMPKMQKHMQVAVSQKNVMLLLVRASWKIIKENIKGSNKAKIINEALIHCQTENVL
jgi:hypothetical protein